MDADSFAPSRNMAISPARKQMPAATAAHPLGAAAPPASGDLLTRLLDAGHLIPTGVEGLYGRGRTFERLVAGVDRLLDELGKDQAAEVMHFPPAIARATFEQSQYLKGFPHFAGTVHTFCGDEAAHRQLLRCIAVGADWTQTQAASDIVLTPAACYPVYALIARRGAVPRDGCAVDVSSYCFRHEPSVEPTRWQMFRQREYVRIGTPEQVAAFRDIWVARVATLAEQLGLPCTVDVANDRFFGRIGALMADSQREQQLKFELLVAVNDGAQPTACASVNYHLDHFGAIWHLTNEAGEVCHTACCGFGLERLTLALLRHHGLDPGGWPRALRARLLRDG